MEMIAAALKTVHLNYVFPCREVFPFALSSLL